MGIRLERVYGSVTTIFTEAFINYIRLTVLAPSVPAADVFGNCIAH
jgi:hypothetical protein